MELTANFKAQGAAAPAEELKLIASAAAGDEAAFERLYQIHVGRVYGLALRLCRSVELAEEVTQEVFMKLWNNAGTFRGKSLLSTWLYQVTTRTVVDRSRSSKGQRLHEVPTEEPALHAGSAWDDHPDPQLERAIQSLPDKARWVLVLHDLEGYRHEDIGNMLGFASGTSKAQLHRARKLLRERLS